MCFILNYIDLFLCLTKSIFGLALGNHSLKFFLCLTSISYVQPLLFTIDQCAIGCEITISVTISKFHSPYFLRTFYSSFFPNRCLSPTHTNTGTKVPITSWLSEFWLMVCLGFISIFLLYPSEKHYSFGRMNGPFSVEDFCHCIMKLCGVLVFYIRVIAVDIFHAK